MSGSRARARIALLTPFPLERAGGVESVTALLKGVLEEAGHRVEVFDITRSKTRFRGLSDFRLFGQFRLARELGALLERRRNEFDVVVANGVYGWNVDHPKSIDILHGNIAAYAEASRDVLGYASYWKTRHLDSWFFTKAFRGKTLVVVSRATGRETARFNGAKSYEVIGNAVDTERFRPRGEKAELRGKIGLPKEAFLALFVGRLSRIKGIDRIVKIADRIPDAVRIVAAGPEAHFRHPRIVEKTGLPRETMPLLYAAADAFLLPSRYEGCSIALLEALATGLPLAVSAVGTAADLREEGSVFAEGVLEGADTDAFVRRIEALAAMSAEERAAIGARQREYAVREHGRDTYGARYLDLVDRVLRGETRTAYEEAAG